MRINQRQLNGYMAAKHEWISENDNYNIAHFGINKDTYNKIHNACIGLYGICGYYPVLKEVNNKLASV